MYVGKAGNLRVRLGNHNQLRGGDKIQFKLVPHSDRMYKDPVRQGNKKRLDIAERLHIRDELERGQALPRNDKLKPWVRDYNRLPRNSRTIRLTRRT